MQLNGLRRALLAVGFAVALGVSAWAADGRPFPHPDRIRYDSACLTIDGKDTFIYSGALHYFRCPKPLWQDRLERMKAAGFNAVETYVAWNVHEPEMPGSLNDFSRVNLQDLEDFMTLAEKVGLYVIIRPGPYICAEWDSGGFPRWLGLKRPMGYARGSMWLRTDDPQSIAWSKHWYDAACPVIAKHQVTRKAPGEKGVILFQLENEYDFSGLPQQVKTNYVKVLAQIALDNGIDVPLFTCWTGLVRGNQDPLLRNVFDSCNLYPRWGITGLSRDMNSLRKNQPDAPMMTTELQGGWFSNVGGKLSEDQDGLTAAQINNLTLYTIQHGETILNYYMLYGGTNLDDGAAAWLTATYDYAAPIREHGGVGDRYSRVWAIGHMLQQHGVNLARSQEVPLDVTVPDKDVTVVLRKAPDGASYYFVRTGQHAQPRKGEAKVKVKGDETEPMTIAYDLEAFGSAIFYLPPGAKSASEGKWLPEPAPEIRRPTALPAPLTITSALRHIDSGSEHWMYVAPGQHREDLHNYDSHFLFYQANADARGSVLRLGSGAREIAGVAVNGHRTPMDRSSGYAVVLPDAPASVLMLHEHPGNPNGGTGMDQFHGLTGAKVARPTVANDPRLSAWKMRLVTKPEGEHPEIAAAFDDSSWQAVARLDGVQLQELQSAIFRGTLTLTDADCQQAKLRLAFSSIDDQGTIYVNGKEIGRTSDWSESYSFDIAKLVHPGANSIAVVVRNLDGPGGLNRVAVEDDTDAPPSDLLCARPQGDVEKWFAPDAEEAGWEQVNIGKDAASLPDALLTWYRMKFEMPATPAGVWVPWYVHLEGVGNGFVYLNGHCLGRYWERGPQHDFYLPECWLNNGTNVVTVSLRTTDKGAAITAASVAPYAKFAEYRPAR